MYDTIVIGAGLAGLMSALSLAEAGQRVLVLAKGQGATHWSAGCVDVWGDAASPLEALGLLRDQQPDHPYNLVGPEAVGAALARLRAVCAAAGYPLAGGLGRNVLLPTALGALRPTCLLPATMAAGDARLLPRTEGRGLRTASPARHEQRDGSRADKADTTGTQSSVLSTQSSILVAGFRELRDFFPPLIAANLRAQGIAADGAYLEMPPAPRRLDFATASLARLFDDAVFRAHVGRQLRALARAHGARVIALPAVLGLREPLAAVRDLQTASGALVFEIPTLPASVPGMRLYGLLAAAIERAGGRIQLNAEVVSGAADPGRPARLARVYTRAAARLQEHRASAFVLATGGIAGGGVRADHTGALRETALGLPLRAPHSRAEWLDARFLSEAGHPIFRSGVAADASLRPLGHSGEAIYENVRVAGAALAGADPVREGCYEGLALATGWAAARALLGQPAPLVENA
jgi:glycerol-3-phosphate dehydrogenase subunit B